MNIWQGDLGVKRPDDPQTVLARHLKYTRDPKGIHATCSYPEPDNLICAVLYKRLPPMAFLADECLLYRCTRTHGWVQVVDQRTVSKATARAWINNQLELGAHAWWFNPRAEPFRSQLNAEEIDKDLRSPDEITIGQVLKQKGQNMFGDVDLFKLAGRGGPDILVGEKELKQRNRDAVVNGVKFSRVGKPVKTPLGYFLTATQAALAQGVKPMHIAYRASLDHEGCSYVSREEYANWAMGNTIKVFIDQ